MADDEAVHRRVHPMIAHVCAEPLSRSSLMGLDLTDADDVTRKRLEQLCRWDQTKIVDLDAEYIDLRGPSVADAAEL